ALGGKPVTGFVALCSPQFLDALTDHSKVKAAYANYQLAQDRLAGDLRDGFTYAGVDFIEYDVEVDGKKYIPDGKARFFPKADIFRQYFVPADYNDAVNTLGKEFYAISEERDKGKGWDLEVQSNPITICHFPEALVELSAT
ncbi:MAG: major capsid protein, partial [Zoogloeaceae bacterium]|nr:major capsid protein [Zoogloeaceae bacterium]